MENIFFLKLSVNLTIHCLTSSISLQADFVIQMWKQPNTLLVQEGTAKPCVMTGGNHPGPGHRSALSSQSLVRLLIRNSLSILSAPPVSSRVQWEEACGDPTVYIQIECWFWSGKKETHESTQQQDLALGKKAHVILHSHAELRITHIGLLPSAR